MSRERPISIKTGLLPCTKPYALAIASERRLAGEDMRMTVFFGMSQQRQVDDVENISLFVTHALEYDAR
eukprot:10341063-Heterocapsa_arctica.AAC.1